jgi:FMN phosphatase YigB (HAD superfamily)
MNIIVDLDGVLVDNILFEEKVLKYILLRISEKYSVTLRKAKKMFWDIGKKYEGKKEWHDWRIFCKELSLGNLWIDAHKKNFRFLKLIPSTKNFLSKLKRDKNKIILASDAIRPVLNMKINYFRLKKFFFLTVSQDDTKTIKNNLKYFRYILRKVRGSVKDYIVLDNRIDRGIETAKKIGMKTIYIMKKEHSHLYTPPKKSVEPDFTVRNLNQAYKIIKEL